MKIAINKHIILFCLFLLVGNVNRMHAQTSDAVKAKLDSLQKCRMVEENDSVLVVIIGEIDNIVYRFDPKLDEELNLEIIAICNRNLNGHTSTKLDRFFVAEMANAYNNLGIIYENSKRTSQAHDYYMMNLKLSQKTNDSIGLSDAHINLGNIYHTLMQDSTALNYYQKGLEISHLIGYTDGIAISNNNIGEVLIGLNQNEEALEYLDAGLEVAIATEFNFCQGLVYSNYGAISGKKGDYDTAAVFLEKAKIIFDRLNNVVSKADTYLSLAELTWLKAERVSSQGLHDEAKQLYFKAIDYAEKGILISREHDLVSVTKGCYELLSSSHKSLGNTTKALAYHELFFESYLEQVEIENVAAIERKSFENRLAQESIKNEEAQKVRDAQIKSQNIQIEKDRFIRNALYSGLFIVLVFGIILFQRFKVTKKQKTIIEIQNRKVEEVNVALEDKNKEIIDSINYAQRLQKAILPPDGILEKHTKESFIIYKPKDIVAGDFYWLEEVGDKLILAVADCTGHGVPGAMLSVVCNNALNRSVREFGLTKPGKILDKTREIIHAEFEHSQENVRDGMDIALCSIEKNIVEYAGANNPFWMIQAGELTEIKATKQPVGKMADPRPFETHTLELTPEASFYLFSDGFVDQFGGDRGKKFKVRAWRELLLRIQGKSMQEQKAEISAVFENWKGEFEQVDDVCVIGVKP